MKSHVKALFGAATSALVLAAAVPSARAEGLALVEHASSDAVTDVGDKGDSVGDILTFANELYDSADKAKVGEDTGHCLRTAVGKSWSCAWTNTLEGGQIMVQGPFLDGQDSVLAITGGTGKYQDVAGDMKLHARDAKSTAYDFVFNFAP